MRTIDQINQLANEILQCRLELYRQIHYLHTPGAIGRYSPNKVEALRQRIKRNEQALRELWHQRRWEMVKV